LFDKCETAADATRFGPYRRTVGRKHRDEAPGIHHVVTRGNNKQVIYADDYDRTLFCLTVERIARRHQWRVLAYALMRNHYHLLLSIGDRGLQGGMHELNLTHAIQFNVRHSRVDHLFGKRYWNRRSTTDASVRNAARHIVLNPLRAGSPHPLEAEPWTSYAATLGIAFPRIPLAVDELLPFFGTNPVDAGETFRDFCLSPTEETVLEETRPVPGAAA
jgi:REP element-mobilizing transposase RayT